MELCGADGWYIFGNDYLNGNEQTRCGSEPCLFVSICRKSDENLQKITRNLSLKKWGHYNTEKRDFRQVPLVLEGLQDGIPTLENTEQVANDLTLTEILNQFLSKLPDGRRKIFMRRY